ncbi:MAG: 3-deoxy-D-manno-octulosonic acid transferase [Pyrinomonadaceae bacterium]
MFFLYGLLLTIGFIILLPRFLYDAVRKGKYAAGFGQRLGNLPEFRRDRRPVLWLHCVSVGETNAALPLAREILRNFPDYRLVVSTTTDTGQEVARRVFADLADLVFYFPFDWRFTVRRALRKLKPEIVLIMETELWFNFIRESRRTGAVVAIVNGRLSEKSFRRYRYIQNFMRRLFHYLDLALVQTADDAKRLVELGIRPGKVKITGNIKFDQSSETGESDLTGELRRRFGLFEGAPLIVAASTHAPEERWLLEAFKKVYKSPLPELPRLLIAPRHPERFSEVAGLIEETGFSWARRSAAPDPADELTDVILLDSIGELRAALPLARMVFVGGSLIPHGGQNILEPALARKAIVTGFYTMNFEAIVKEFLRRDALIQLPELEKEDVPGKLAGVLTQLLGDQSRSEELAENALAAAAENRGATRKTVEFLRSPLAGHLGKKLV